MLAGAFFPVFHLCRSWPDSFLLQKQTLLISKFIGQPSQPDPGLAASAREGQGLWYVPTHHTHHTHHDHHTHHPPHPVSHAQPLIFFGSSTGQLGFPRESRAEVITIDPWQDPNSSGAGEGRFG